MRAPLAIAAAIPVLMLWTLPWASHRLATLPGFTGAWIALVFACDAVTAFLLIGQYRMGGGPRLLVLACGYVWSASMALLLACAVPGIIANHPILGTGPNSMWWLWVLRHVGPPLCIGLALAPWPAWAARGAPRSTERDRHALLTLLVLLSAVGLLALVMGRAPGALRAIVDPDTQQVTAGATSVVLIVNLAAVVLSVLGVVRRGSHRGLESWAVVAAVAFLGDSTYMFMWEPRFSVAEYGGRALALGASVTVLLFMLRDISLLHQRVAADAHRLEDQNTELREANALRAHVTAVVSHDMRTPLAGLQGYLEMLQDDDLDPEFATRMVDRSWMLTRRLMLLSENLLSAATLEHADLVVIRERLDMKQQLAECATCFPDLDLRVECPPDLTVDADSLRLQQVLANLVRNAQKHGAEPVLIRVTGDGSTVTIRVSDSGPGVPPAFVPHLFDRYTQGGTATGGSGLGLSVVRDLVAAHAGQVWYDGADRAFVVSLPSPTADHEGARLRPTHADALDEFEDNVRV